jgi:hypothetical protein
VVLLVGTPNFALLLSYEERFRAVRMEDSMMGILTALSAGADEASPVGGSPWSIPRALSYMVAPNFC